MVEIKTKNMEDKMREYKSMGAQITTTKGKPSIIYFPFAVSDELDAEVYNFIKEFGEPLTHKPISWKK